MKKAQKLEEIEKLDAKNRKLEKKEREIEYKKQLFVMMSGALALIVSLWWKESFIMFGEMLGITSFWLDFFLLVIFTSLVAIIIVKVNKGIRIQEEKVIKKKEKITEKLTELEEK